MDVIEPPERSAGSAEPDAAADAAALREGWRDLLAECARLRDSMLSFAEQSAQACQEVHARFSRSAENLLHYLALRRQDVRPLQMQLAARGLSSLGRAESHVLGAVDAVGRLLEQLCGRPWPPLAAAPLDFAAGQTLLDRHAADLLGPPRAERSTRIMVTMPSEAADDYQLVRDLLAAGMDCMRINCAHDDRGAWERMIGHLRRAQEELGIPCQVSMDLAGPKLRTGPLLPGPCVLKVRPGRDKLGRVTSPARLWLTPAENPVAPPTAATAALQLPGDFLARLQPGDRLRLRDARRARRSLWLVSTGPTGCWAEARSTIYFTPETKLHAPRASGASVTPCGIPPAETVLALHVGDLLLLTDGAKPGRPAVSDSSGAVLQPATIGCTLPEVLADVRPGERIWFDDGLLGGRVERADAAGLLVRITQTRAGGGKLRADKGINLPDSRLRLSALTDKDLQDLEFVAAQADVVALSFANSAEDVETLRAALERLGAGRPALLLKIETQRGFANLPSMLLAAMRGPCCGVMIARGDLAVECGFERLAEVQEEILWICEAGHVPVVWATQVLEHLAKDGLPSRAEITDAAMGHRAECVMLNKGPHVVQAVQSLDNILRRMQDHQTKKRALLRGLQLARTFAEPPSDEPAPR